jgi:hypothetical protein
MSDKISEADWVTLVTRLEEAMCIVPFMPRQEDVVTLLSLAANGNQHALCVEDLEQQVERLRTALEKIATGARGEYLSAGIGWRIGHKTIESIAREALGQR